MLFKGERKIVQVLDIRSSNGDFVYQRLFSWRDRRKFIRIIEIERVYCIFILLVFAQRAVLVVFVIDTRTYKANKRVWTLELLPTWITVPPCLKRSPLSLSLTKSDITLDHRCVTGCFCFWPPSVYLLFVLFFMIVYPG